MTKEGYLLDKNSKIYVAGHHGLIGSAIWRALQKDGYKNLVGKSSSELDLRNARAVQKFFEQEKPEYVFVAAAKVGGIKANMDFPADFIYDNLQIQNNVIHNAYKNKVKKLLFLGSSCIYPRESEQPIKEDYFMTGKFEPTNEPYAIAKTAGIGMCQAYNKQHGCNFISVMPTNLYGIKDNYHPQNSHLVAALIKKFHEAKIGGAKEVVLWGTGTPKRELLYSDDAAEACVLLMKKYNSSEIINVGTGIENTVREVAEVVKEVIGFGGEIVFDSTKPDGMIRRVMDVNKINSLGWRAKTNLKDGIKKSYDWFLENVG